MSFTELAVLGLVLVMVLLLLRMPIGLAMALGGFIGLALIRGVPASLSNIVVVAFRQGSFYMMTVIPLFIFMAQLLSKAGVAETIFVAVRHLFGPVRGGDSSLGGSPGESLAGR